MHDEFPHDIVRVIRIADRIRTSQEHLKKHVWNLFSEQPKSFVRGFAQKTHAGVESRAAPHLEAEQTGRPSADEVGNRKHIIGSHASSEKRLVSISQRGVRHHKRFLFPKPLGKLFGPH